MNKNDNGQKQCVLRDISKFTHRTRSSVHFFDTFEFHSEYISFLHHRHPISILMFFHSFQILFTFILRIYLFLLLRFLLLIKAYSFIRLQENDIEKFVSR